MEIYYIVIINIIIFVIGYFFGKNNYISNNNTYKTHNSNLFKKSGTQQSIATKIDINESKVVTKIKTDNLDKKFNTLGEITKSSEDIVSSINKLKNLKK